MPQTSKSLRFYWLHDRIFVTFNKNYEKGIYESLEANNLEVRTGFDDNLNF